MALTVFDWPSDQSYLTHAPDRLLIEKFNIERIILFHIAVSHSYLAARKILGVISRGANFPQLHPQQIQGEIIPFQAFFTPGSGAKFINPVFRLFHFFVEFLNSHSLRQ